MKGRLPQRPLAPLDTQLENGGIRLWREGADMLHCEGRLSPGNYHLSGNVSSQYTSGLLFALPLLDGPSRLTVAHPIESADYIAMTLEALAAFGQKPVITEHPEKNPNITQYDIEGSRAFTGLPRIAAEGDWSNAAFWLCAGAMPGGDIRLDALNKNSAQGDREICAILARMGADVRWDGGTLRVREGRRLGTEIDARAIPDLVPALSAVAAAAETGEKTVIRNAARLRLKESDRLLTTAQTLVVLGADITEREDSLLITGRRQLDGGAVRSCGDHRIAMMAAIAAAACTGAVRIAEAEAVNKSYPAFWNDLAALGKNIEMEE
jgi:3-phosphoshikimate 1-carboxyvinyltransferase